MPNYGTISCRARHGSAFHIRRTGSGSLMGLHGSGLLLCRYGSGCDPGLDFFLHDQQATGPPDGPHASSPSVGHPGLPDLGTVDGTPMKYTHNRRVPGVYDDWEDCRRQVHRFSCNSYKGYPTRVEAEGRYARYLAGEMRDMRRNRMKTMAFVMMVIMTMLVMFYVIVV
ncbi:hypothetical protein QYE76_007876 [Lolium multiflorum]|uniref:Ribonuclease H1 N-terminal domain-containing protein n=1 Tax=Lolium multiflorum TaxID=4521 RepID=A0AAD8VFF5_LOLMU|nr:hypothetical protein QYE76_007876 [Lolium multiflorum]